MGYTSVLPNSNSHSIAFVWMQFIMLLTYTHWLRWFVVLLHETVMYLVALCDCFYRVWSWFRRLKRRRHLCLQRLYHWQAASPLRRLMKSWMMMMMMMLMKCWSLNARSGLHGHRVLQCLKLWLSDAIIIIIVFIVVVVIIRDIFVLIENLCYVQL